SAARRTDAAPFARAKRRRSSVSPIVSNAGDRPNESAARGASGARYARLNRVKVRVRRTDFCVIASPNRRDRSSRKATNSCTCRTKSAAPYCEDPLNSETQVTRGFFRRYSRGAADVLEKYKT